VKTDMGGPGGRLEVDEAIGHLVRTIESRSRADGGGFFNYDGTPLPW
jgi:hypothetical protein